MDKDFLNKTLEKWKLYAQISDLGSILRRYFVMNAFDGVLTILGIIIASFISFLAGKTITQGYIIIIGLSTTFAIAISGIMGAFLSESAERRKSSLELMHAMGIDSSEEIEKLYFNDEHVELSEEDYYPKIELKNEVPILNGQPLERVQVDPIANTNNKAIETPYPNTEINTDNNKKTTRVSRAEESKHKERKIKEEKSENERAESFASIVLSLTDGLSPALGSILGLLPFFFGAPSLIMFIISFILEIILLFSLGAYLAKISEDSIIKYGIQMVMAGVLTVLISLLIGGGH